MLCAEIVAAAVLRIILPHEQRKSTLLFGRYRGVGAKAHFVVHFALAVFPIKGKQEHNDGTITI